MYYFTESNILFNFSQCDPEKLTKYMMTARNRTTITRPLNISIDLAALILHNAGSMSNQTPNRNLRWDKHIHVMTTSSVSIKSSLLVNIDPGCDHWLKLWTSLIYTLYVHVSHGYPIVYHTEVVLSSLKMWFSHKKKNND